MRRTIKVMAAAAMMLALTAPVALGTHLSGTNDGYTNVTGKGGNDVLRGTAHPDIISGYAGADVLYGRGGGDQVYSGSGADFLHGGRGADFLLGDGGTDLIYGGSGDDFVDSEGDRSSDYVDCGRGHDTVVRTPGSGDTFVNCEEFLG